MSTTVGKRTSGERSTSAVSSSPDRTRSVNRRIRPELSSEDDGGHFMFVEVDTVVSRVFVYTSPDRSGPNPGTPSEGGAQLGKEACWGRGIAKTLQGNRKAAKAAKQVEICHTLVSLKSPNDFRQRNKIMG